METIENALSNQDYMKIAMYINDYIKQHTEKFKYLEQYSLIIGSKDDNAITNESIITLLNKIKEIFLQIRNFFNLIKSFQYIHKNEKVECFYKLKSSYKKCELLKEKVFSLSDEIKIKNINMINNYSKGKLNSIDNSIDINKVKRNINQFIDIVKNDISKYLEESDLSFKDNNNNLRNSNVMSELSANSSKQKLYINRKSFFEQYKKMVIEGIVVILIILIVIIY